MDEEFEREKRAYCAGCNVSLNCPVGHNNFKTCTRKGSNLLRLKGKHIPTYAEEKASLASDSMRICPKCNGPGWVEDVCNHLAFTKTCELCDGRGKIPTEIRY